MKVEAGEPLGQVLDPEGDFEPRADNVDEKVLLEGTVTGDIFAEVHKALTNRRMCLVEGPRGCGKTHMMRYAYLSCLTDLRQPFAIYVSFSRYLRLEPFLRTRLQAISYFQSWVLCRIVLAAYEACGRAGGFTGGGAAAAASLQEIVGFSKGQATKLVGRLERAASPKSEDLEAIEDLTVEVVATALDRLCELAGRSRTVVFLDDAALTLTPDFLVEFFEVARTLNTQTIAPKCSVYPGTTEYGPRFHARQQATTVKAWLPVDGDNYADVMLLIGDRRFGAEAADVPIEVKRYLAYTAFGMPRAYLTLLNDFMRATGTRQQVLNALVQAHRIGVVAEYKTLRLKMPKFASIVDAGAHLFELCIEEVRAANDELEDRRQLEIGFDAEGLEPLMQRMCALLTEVGLLYRLPDVKHGGDRVYVRFIPHVGALMAVRAFSARSRGQDIEKIVAFLQRRRVEHPVRRTMSKLLAADLPLHINLPPCEYCHEVRVTEDQKFCHRCGEMLTDASNFGRIMKLPVADVDTLSNFQRQVLDDLQIVRIEDFFSLEDPGGTLRRTKGVGPRYSKRIIDKLQAFVDEFLS